jgi:hypothetical protein
MKKLNQKRPNGAGAGVPASPAPKSATDNLLAILKHNVAMDTRDWRAIFIRALHG